MQIDHLLPKYLQANKPLFDQIKSDYILASDFELDSYENFLPSCKKCNNEDKGREVKSYPNWFHWNEIIQKNLNKVYALEEKKQQENTENKQKREGLIGIEKGIINFDDILEAMLHNEGNQTIADLHKKIDLLYGSDRDVIKPLTLKENQFVSDTLEFLNRLLEHEFKIVKIRILDNKKIGIGLTQYLNTQNLLCISYCLYILPSSSNDKIITEITHTDWEKLLKMGRSFQYSSASKESVFSSPKDFASQIIIELIKRLFTEKWLIHDNLAVIEDCLFAFLDKWYPKLVNKNVLPKNTYDYHDIQEFNARFAAIFQEPKLTISSMSHNPENIVHIEIFQEMIGFLVNHNINEIQRPYQDLKESFDCRDWDQYCALLKSHAAIFYKDLVRAYFEMMKVNFPIILNKIKPFNGANKILIELDLDAKKIPENPRGHCQIYYCIDKTSEKNLPEIEVFDKKENLIKIDNTIRKIYFKQKEYYGLCISVGSLPAFTSPNFTVFVYNEIIKSLDQYFEATSPEINSYLEAFDQYTFW